MVSARRPVLVGLWFVAADAHLTSSPRDAAIEIVAGSQAVLVSH